MGVIAAACFTDLANDSENGASCKKNGKIISRNHYLVVLFHQMSNCSGLAFNSAKNVVLVVRLDFLAFTGIFK